MGLENYEELKYCSVANITGIAWQAPIVTETFGAGWAAGANTHTYGLKRWNLTANVSPDTENYTVTFVVDGETFTKSRYRYFREFFERHLLKGNKPFIIRESDTNKRFMVSFADPNFDFERMLYAIFGGIGLTVNERRVADVDFNDDGSIIEPVVEIGFYLDNGEFSADDGEFAASF